MLLRLAPATSLSARILNRANLAAIGRQWHDLSTRSVEDNVYYTPGYANSLLDTVARRTNLHAVTAWQGDRLVGFMPVTRSRCPVAGIIAAGQAWQTDYTFSCTPLLDRACAQEAAAALIEALAQCGRGEWVIPNLNVEGPACRALISALDFNAAAWSISGQFERAFLDGSTALEDLMASHVGAKRRRELARNRRRLEELGKVEHATFTAGAGLRKAVEAFLEIEKGGWKGERGTALASRPDSLAFALNVFDGEATRCRADVLLLDGKPIAGGLIAFSGDTGFTVKNAYDETFARYGAGLLLEIDVLTRFLEERWVARLDAATNGGHVIDRLWPGRTTVGNLAFSLSTRGAARRLSLFENFRHQVGRGKTLAKLVLGR